MISLGLIWALSCCYNSSTYRREQARTMISLGLLWSLSCWYIVSPNNRRDQTKIMASLVLIWPLSCWYIVPHIGGIKQKIHEVKPCYAFGSQEGGKLTYYFVNHISLFLSFIHRDIRNLFGFTHARTRVKVTKRMEDISNEFNEVFTCKQTCC